MQHRYVLPKLSQIHYALGSELIFVIVQVAQCILYIQLYCVYNILYTIVYTTIVN